MSDNEIDQDVGLDFNSGSLGDSFMKIQTVLDTFSAPHSVLSEIPQGRKDGMFFIIAYEPKMKIIDDCGEWQRPSCPRSFFCKKGGNIISLFLKKDKFCVEKNVNKHKDYVPLEPQPRKEEVLELVRRYETLKADSSEQVFKRRVTWFQSIPKEFDFLTHNEALVEYTGEFPDGQKSSKERSSTNYWQDCDPEEMEDTDEFKWAVKVVLKRQMRDLIKQLKEQGEEIAVLEVNITENTSSYFGTETGEWFVSEQKNLLNGFSNFCKANSKKRVPAAKQGTPKSVSVPGRTVSVSSKKPEITVQDTPTVKVTVSTNLCGGISEQELGCLVGRIIASQMCENNDKGDGSSGGTKYDSIIETLNLKPKETAVRSTRSGRKVTNKYLESLKNKRGKNAKSEDEDSANDTEVAAEDKAILNQLFNIDTAILKRVQVTTGGGKSIDLVKTVLTNGEQMESVAATLVKELHATSAKNMANKKLVKVVVNTVDEDDFMKIEVVAGLTKKIKSEYTEMDDSDMECTDFVGEDIDDEEDDEDDDEMENDMQDFDMSDPDFKSPNAVPFKSTPVRAVGTHGTPKPYTPNSSQKLVRKKKYQKPLSERMPMECEHCGQYVSGKSNLKSHIRRVHLKVKNHKCTICQKGFWSNNSLESHMLSVHTRRCDSCHEYVVESVPWGTGIDMRMKRDVICTCGSIVSIYSSFGRRRQYLRDDEPDENGDIPSRAKSNAGTKYACGTCGKLFMKKSNCERHSRAHTDFKGISCDICGSTFAYENSLKRHLQVEHGIIKHACEVCGKNYSNETALKVHYIKAHAQQNLSIGENLVMIVKEKSGNDATDLEEQMEEIMEGEGEDDAAQNSAVQTQAERIVVTRRPDGSTEQHIMVSGPQELVVTGSQDLVITEDQQLLATQADIGHLEEGQIVVTQGEGGQVQVTTGDPELTQDSAQRIVQQAIQDGHMVAQDGNMSIIIKQLPMAQVSMSQ